MDVEQNLMRDLSPLQLLMVAGSGAIPGLFSTRNGPDIKKCRTPGFKQLDIQLQVAKSYACPRTHVFEMG